MRRQLGDNWGRLDRQRVGTWWRVWGMLKDEIVPYYRRLILEGRRLGSLPEGVGGTAARRTLQRLPPEALDVFYRCEASKLEGMPIAA